jgi:hypothetical protein
MSAREVALEPSIALGHAQLLRRNKYFNLCGVAQLLTQINKEKNKQALVRA